MIDSTLSGSVWLEEKAGVVEEVGRPRHVTPSLPVLLGCLGGSKGSSLSGPRPSHLVLGTLSKEITLYKSLGNRAQLFLGLFSLVMVERADSVQGHSINQWNKKVRVLLVKGVEGPESGVTGLIPKKSQNQKGTTKASWALPWCSLPPVQHLKNNPGVHRLRFHYSRGGGGSGGNTTDGRQGGWQSGA